MSVFQSVPRRRTCDVEAFSSFGIGVFNALPNGTTVNIILIPSVGQEALKRSGEVGS